MKRRRVLQGMGAVGTAGLAGCFGGDDGGNGNGGNGNGGNGGNGNGGNGNGGNGNGQDLPSGSLRFAQVKSPIEFDPIVLNDVPSGEIAGMIFEGLYEYDEGTGHQPQLAKGEPEVNDEGTQFTVEIKDGATFQNGDPVTAEDVAYSFMRTREEETENANEISMIDSIDAVDEKTAQFNLKYPFAPFMNTLHRSIVPKSVREEDPDAFNTEKPVGSGAFEFTDWTEGDFARVERYEDYWGDELPNLAEVEFVPVEEATTRITTLQNGENDVIKEIPPDLWEEAQNMDGAEVLDKPGINYFYLAFNCKEGPTTDKTVREAVDLVFDMDQAVSNFVEPTGVRQYSPLPRATAEDWDMPLDEWESMHTGRDLDKAKDLFDEAGVPMDYDWRIIVPPDDKREQIGVTVGNGLQEVGFDNVEVQRLDWPAFLDQYVSGDPADYNMYTLGWSGTPDPDSFTYYLLTREDDTLGLTNGTFWGDNSDVGKEVSDMFVEARETPDREKRQQLYQEGITKVLEEKPHIPSYNLKESFGVRNNVSGFEAHSVAGFRLFSPDNGTNVSVDEE